MRKLIQIKNWKSPILGLAASLLSVLLLIVAGCTSPEPEGNTTEAPTGNYRSDSNYLSVYLAPGWATVEGPTLYGKALEALLFFNSWNETGAWASHREIGMPLSNYPETTIAHMRQDGAFVALFRVWVMLVPPGEEPPEYERNDLLGLLSIHDWRTESGSGVKSITFYKWGRYFRLDVYCSPGASDQAVNQLNDLLRSWRLDAVPAGDEEWASIQARKLLPESVEPGWFPIVPGSHGNGDFGWTTETKVQDKTVKFRTRLYRFGLSTHGVG